MITYDPMCLANCLVAWSYSNVKTQPKNCFRMKMATTFLYRLLSALLIVLSTGRAVSQENRSYKIFQFPANRIPVIDGKSDDWKMVPGDYTVGMNQLWDDSKKHTNSDPANLDVKVTVGWIKGMNRLYFLYEAHDNYWDFSLSDLHLY